MEEVPEDVAAAFAARIEPVRAALHSLINSVEARAERADSQPSPGSPAAADDEEDVRLVPPFSSPPILDARHFGRLQLHAAGEYFSSTGLLLQLREPIVFSDKVLVRSGIEAAARAAWLLDPLIDGRTRAARGINERLYGLGEVKDFASGEELVKQQARRALILANAKKAGYLTQTPKRDPWHVGTEKRPSSTAVMGWLLNANEPNRSRMGLGTAMQKYLSLFVHSTPMGLMTQSERELARSRGQWDVDLPLVSSSDDAGQLLGLAVLAYVAAAGRALTYFGWMDEAWRKETVNSFKIAQRYGN